MVLIFIVMFQIEVTLTQTHWEKGCIKVIHICNKQKLKLHLTFSKKSCFSYATTVCLAHHMQSNPCWWRVYSNSVLGCQYSVWCMEICRKDINMYVTTGTFSILKFQVRVSNLISRCQPVHTPTKMFSFSAEVVLQYNLLAKL